MNGALDLCCLYFCDDIHLRIGFDVNHGTAVEGVESLHAEDVFAAFDEFDDAEGKGIWTSGRAAGKDAVDLL